MTKPDLTEFRQLSLTIGQKGICKLDASASNAVAEGLISLTDKDALMAAAISEDGTITVGGVERWCRKRGLAVSAMAITSHRYRKCACFK